MGGIWQNGLSDSQKGYVKGATGFLSTIAGRQGQAKSYKAQARQLEQQAKLTRRQGELDRLSVAGQRSALTRNFQALQGANTVRAAAGNVDAAVGSAADVAMGNAQLYGGDIAANTYQQQLVTWGAENRAREMDAQARYYSKLAKSSGNLFGTLLDATITGLGAAFL